MEIIDDNSLVLDVNTLDYIIHNRKKGRLKLYLGEFTNGEFKKTVETIKDLDIENQTRLKNHIRTLVQYF
jgi:hypothetical protein